MKNLFQRITQSRWAWGVSGLPSLGRARALFLAKRYTMTLPVRCRVLWNLCQKVMRSGTPGCFVECGVWKGGSSAVMGLAARHAGQERIIHLFDSFEGLPEPGELDGQASVDYSGGQSSGAMSSIHKCEAGIEEVRRLMFGLLRFSPAQVRFHTGWFQDTVPADASGLGPIAVLRLDGDWYESTRICLEHLYPLLAPGGVLILDDYFCWEGCRKAADEYRVAHGITEPIIQVDCDSGYWLKK